MEYRRWIVNIFKEYRVNICLKQNEYLYKYILNHSLN